MPFSRLNRPEQGRAFHRICRLRGFNERGSIFKLLPLPSRLLTAQSGLTFTRRFSSEGVSPYDEVQWERRTASITDTKGNTIFEQKDVEVPVDWSMTATNIVASKYLHGQMGTPERETGVRQLVGRVAETIRDWGIAGGYFATAARCRHLPRRAGAHAAHPEGRPSTRRSGSTWAATGWSRIPTARTGTGTRSTGGVKYSATGYQQPAVLGLLHQRRRRLAGLHPDPGQDRGHALQVGLGHRHQPVVHPRLAWNCSPAAARPAAR